MLALCLLCVAHKVPSSDPTLVVCVGQTPSAAARWAGFPGFSRLRCGGQREPCPCRDLAPGQSGPAEVGGCLASLLSCSQPSASGHFIPSSLSSDHRLTTHHLSVCPSIHPACLERMPCARKPARCSVGQVTRPRPCLQPSCQGAEHFQQLWFWRESERVFQEDARSERQWCLEGAAGRKAVSEGRLLSHGGAPRRGQGALHHCTLGTDLWRSSP